MRPSSVFIVAAVSASLSVSCGRAPNCTVTRDVDAGSATITCPDGTSATLHDGARGTAGATGIGGPEGPVGPPGTSCTVSENFDAGTKTISCTDGTRVTVADGAVGPPGPRGSAGDAGPPWLVRLVPEPPGANCAAGGTRVVTGPDTNSNGTLEVPAEVQSSAYVCNSPDLVLHGDLTIHDATEWSAFANSGYVVVTGQLIISSPSLNSLSPPASALHTVGGFRIVNSPALATASLPSLERINGNLFVDSEPALTTLSFPLLASVGGAFEVYACTALVNMNAPLLGSVGQGMGVAGNNSLSTLSLAALASIALDFNVINNLTLATLSAPQLRAVGGQLTVTGNTALQQCQVDGLKNKLTSGPTQYTSSGNNGAGVCPP